MRRRMIMTPFVRLRRKMARCDTCERASLWNRARPQVRGPDSDGNFGNVGAIVLFSRPFAELWIERNSVGGDISGDIFNG